jgi:hypothetical protein
LLLFKSKYDLEDLNAFSELQTALINARVLPEARELINLRSIKQNVCSSLLTKKSAGTTQRKTKFIAHFMTVRSKQSP